MNAVLVLCHRPLPKLHYLCIRYGTTEYHTNRRSHDVRIGIIICASDMTALCCRYHQLKTQNRAACFPYCSVLAVIHCKAAAAIRLSPEGQSAADELL